MHCLARETIVSKDCRISGCSHELGKELVLAVTLFRTNIKSYLYFINNNSSLHIKYFIKFYQFIDNNNFFKLNNVWLIFDTPFFANFSRIQKYAPEFD